MSNLKPTIYTVATAHLDTSWNWTFETTLKEYLPKTLRENFEYFRQFPDYIFSFEGSYRYELAEEYYPEEFERLRGFVESGRWCVSGSAYENGDVNIPSPEALIRNIMYGNGYFFRTFGKRSADIYLPDCFGFGRALPGVAAHCGLLGFTTQKLVWSSAYGIPFDIGKWYGTDGKWIYVSADARDYNASLARVRTHPAVIKKLRDNIKNYDLPFAEILHGVGDRGGSPRVKSMNRVAFEVQTNASAKSDVIMASTDRLFRDMDEKLSDEQKARLPEWKNELVFTDHAVGSYTSRAQSKRFNRRCECLADAAERFCSAAYWLGGMDYPQSALDTAWKRTIAHQFHDDITGTSLMECYKRNWNDYVLALNGFAEEYRAAAGSLARGMDTSFVEGTAVLVTNPLETRRKQAVALNVSPPEGFSFAAVFDGDGNEVPSQTKREKNGFCVTFVADVPAVGCRVYDLRGSKRSCTLRTDLYVSEKYLENSKYKVYLNKNGDISSIFDKINNRELLAAPVIMGLYEYNGSIAWPAWEMGYDEVMAPCTHTASQPSFRIADFGCARVAIETVRRAKGSIFKQTVSLDSEGDAVSVYNEVDWRSTKTLLKTSFPLAVSNEKATYDLGLGVIERGSNSRRLYEVPAQMWGDITEPDGSFGVSVFSDSRTGWDKPDGNTLRLTGMHTPCNPYRSESAQHLMEIGLNRWSFALFSHGGSWRNGTQMSANAFNRPMAAFAVPSDKQKKQMGDEHSFISVSNGVLIRAVKKAQESGELVVRFNESIGSDKKDVRFSFGNGIASARELLGDEQEKGAARVENGELVFDIEAYGVKTFAFTPFDPEQCLQKDESICVDFGADTDITSSNSERADGVFPGGTTLPSELYPQYFTSGGIEFRTESGRALRCTGQKIKLPDEARMVYVVAASVNGDKDECFTVNGQQHTVKIRDAGENIGAWDLFALGEAGYIKREPIALSLTHRHSAQGDVYGAISCFFKYGFDCAGGELVLPDDEDVLIIAVSCTEGIESASPLCELYDSLEKRNFGFALTPRQFNGEPISKLMRKKGKANFIKNYAVNRLNFSTGRQKKLTKYS